MMSIESNVNNVAIIVATDNAMPIVVNEARIGQRVMERMIIITGWRAPMK